MQNNFCLLLRVRYGECDAQGVVFNARYADYVDIAVTEFMRALFGSYQDLIESGMDTKVVRMLIEWKSPAKFDDILSIMVETGHIGNTSFRLNIVINDHFSNRRIAVAENTYVMVSADRHEKMSVPDHVRRKLEYGAPGVIYNHAGINP